jgi:methylated-DNA-[protein]-cysteine S-methyltransferase
MIHIGRLSSSPIGPLWAALSGSGLVAVEWDMPEADFISQLEKRFHSHIKYDVNKTAVALSQLSEYLSGFRRQFDLPLDLSDRTPFQRQVLQLTFEIPYGQTSTYKQLALRLHRPHSSRAVGRVEATNPIPLVIPCHRVLGSDGSLHGYGGPGGIKLKAWLLELELNALKQVPAG